MNPVDVISELDLREIKTPSGQPWTRSLVIELINAVQSYYGNRRAKKGTGRILDSRLGAARLSNGELKPNRPKTSARSVLGAIPGMPIRETVSLWQNALRTLGDDKKASQHELARQVLKAIGLEWDRGRRSPRDEWFAWPSTEAHGGSGNLDTRGWEKEGILSFMGYKVGNNGEAQRVRERILSAIFSGPLPPLANDNYLAEWGSPRTVGRLRKMANAIASFTRNGKHRRDSVMRSSVRDWERDLEFLYYEYYVSKFHFSWPTTAIK